jgi:CDP-glucose 4,6-dehydratase
MRVLVTGSEGLIGRPLCNLLGARGDEVQRYDLALAPSQNVLYLGYFQDAIETADAVIHLAAQSGVEAARKSAYNAWHLNVVGTLNVLEACRQNDKPVVVASSNHIYGHGARPVSEEAIQLQLDTYSATKHAADLAARSYAHNYGLKTAIVRNTNCFGPNDPHSDHIIPGTILSLLQGEPPVIWSDGLTKKAYLYVDDVAEAYISVLDWLMGGGRFGEAFNVSGPRVSVLELVNLVCDVMGSELKPVVLGRSSDSKDEWLDDSKVRRVTGWYPKTGLREAIRRTVAGFKARHPQTDLESVNAS